MDTRTDAMEEKDDDSDFHSPWASVASIWPQTGVDMALSRTTPESEAVATAYNRKH